MDELRCVVHLQKPDFICLTETWSNESHPDVFFKLEGYNLVCRRDRTDTKQGVGGGLLLWANETIKVSELKSVEIEQFNQGCGARIPLASGGSLNLVLLYRPHNLYESPDTEMVNNNKLCEVLSSVRNPAVFVGDFNLSDIDWGTLHGTRACSRQFLDTCQDNFLTQHVDFTTRQSSNTSPDLVLSTDESLVHGVSDIGKLGSSDHTMMTIEVVGELPASVSVEEVPDWRKADMDKLREFLAEVNWEEELSGNTIHCWDKFKEKLQMAQDAAVPKKKRRVGSKPVWVTQNVMRKIRKKRRLWKTYTESKDYAE